MCNPGRGRGCSAGITILMICVAEKMVPCSNDGCGTLEQRNVFVASYTAHFAWLPQFHFWFDA